MSKAIHYLKSKGKSFQIEDKPSLLLLLKKYTYIILMSRVSVVKINMHFKINAEQCHRPLWSSTEILCAVFVIVADQLHQAMLKYYKIEVFLSGC